MIFFKRKQTRDALRIYFSKIFFYFFLFFSLIFIIRFLIISPGKVNGRSMEPTYIDDQIFFINKFSYFLHPPKRYDIVQIFSLRDKKMMIKRIVAMPGEIVIIKRGKIYIKKSIDAREEVLDESKYLTDITKYTTVKSKRGPVSYLVGDHEYFVVGDNRPHSVDSRIYGAISRSSISGKVVTSFSSLFGF